MSQKVNTKNMTVTEYEDYIVSLVNCRVSSGRHAYLPPPEKYKGIIWVITVEDYKNPDTVTLNNKTYQQRGHTKSPSINCYYEAEWKWTDLNGTPVYTLVRVKFKDQAA